ncbi:membrane protein [Xanthomonas cannabis pv. phaseoli]|uniref:Membrane protein n=1 Tax=Xanthomonas cannabis pv. phaseoli TaxID=1885902 RepID=A0AB34PF96_9XANT|nr:DoxX family protein [Xanthomonas cannabis]KGK59393.1 membrane protein [Xanthomonas cannabis pv. phaseoli]
MNTLYTYWISTALLSALYLTSAAVYLAKGDVVRKAQAALGYSAPLLVPFMIAIKLLGPLVILSRVNLVLSELAYAGMFYHLLLSGMAHLSARTPKGAIPAALGLVVLVASFTTQNAARHPASPYAAAVAASLSTP